jgi:hypothetical protein
MMKNDINDDVNPMYELARLLGLVLLHTHSRPDQFHIIYQHQ